MTDQHKHTPGPWDVVEGRTLFHVETANKGDGSPCGDPICSIPKKRYGDARLIAACPEMLEILKDIGTWIETNLKLGTINAGTANRDGDLVSQIRAIIAKATGV